MKKIIALSFLFIITLSAASLAGDLNQKAVAEIVEKVKAGKNVSETSSYPADHTQVFSFYQKWPDVLVAYYIDMRAQLCFFGRSTGAKVEDLTTVPCKALKDGYPLVAPIIDWEK